MSIGVGQGALGWGAFQAQMDEFATSNGETITYLSQALALGELAKEHGHQLIPAGKALAVTLGSTLANDARKLGPGNNLQDLAEKTRIKLHSRDSFVAVSFLNIPYHNRRLCSIH
jgi:hypothetical protein